MRPLHPDSIYIRMCCRRWTLQSIPGHLNWHLTSHRYTAALQSAQIPHPWPNCNVKLRDRNQSYFCSNWKKFFLFACFPAQECWWLRGGGWPTTPEGGGDVTWSLLAPAPGAIGLYYILRKGIAIWVFGCSFGFLILPCSVGRGPAWSTSKATRSRWSPRSSSQGRTGKNIFCLRCSINVAINVT